MLRRALYRGIALSMATFPAYADPIEELVITARHDTRTIDVTDQLIISPDVAQFLKQASCVNVNSNGPLTCIPQYSGLFVSRISLSLHGSHS